MNKIISEILKKLTVYTMVLIFSFILLAPTADALQYDPSKYESKYIPIGDVDPWDEADVFDPPPDDNDSAKTELLSYKDNIDIIIISINSIFNLNVNFIKRDK